MRKLSRLGKLQATRARRIRLFTPLLIESLEPRAMLTADDQISEAVPFTIGSTVSGTISPGDDVDMFAVSVSANRTLLFDIDRPTGNLDSYIRLFNSGGMQLAANDDAAGPLPENSSLESFLQFALTPGTYYLGVSALPNTSYDPVTGTGDVAGSTGDYTLTITALDPDDQISEAVPFIIGSTISGTISTGDDVDMFAVTVASNRTLLFDIDLPTIVSLDSYIRLFNAAGTQLAANDDAAGPLPENNNLESFLQFALTPGTYYLGVSSLSNSAYDPITGNGDASGSSGDYTLTITDPNADDDQISEAVPFTIGSTVSGTISPGDDVDMFAVTVTANRTLLFDIDRPTGNLDSYIRLFNSAGTQLAANDDAVGPLPENSSLESFVQFALTPGTYYLGVSALPNTTYDPLTGNGDVVGSTGDYLLTITDLNADADDQISEAVPFTIGSTVSGTISPGDDVDMFAVTVTANRTLLFDIDRPSGNLDSYIRLFNSAGTQLAANDDAVGPLPENSDLESFLQFALTPGTYYLGVSALPNTSYDPLTGNGDVVSTAGDYTLTITDPNTDPDDQIPEAVPFTIGSTVSGTISPGGDDVDMFAVTVTANRTLLFDIDRPTGNLDSYIRLFNSAGTELAANDDAVGPLPENSGLESFLQFALTAGTYYLGVSALPNATYDPLTGDGDVGGSTGDYSLTITGANLPPSFTKGLDQAVTDGSGLRTVPGWATAISPGPPDEASQAVDFIVTNNSNALFSVQPAINPAGTLTFAPQPNVRGLVLVTVVLHDNGGTLNGGVDTSSPQTFKIDISKPNLWHNNAPLPLPKIGSLDVDYDTFISPIDAVLVINYLNILTGNGDDQVPPNAPVAKTGNLNSGMAEFLDTGGAGPLGDQPDNFISPIDAVLVINWLNNNPVTASLPEGEPSAAAAPDVLGRPTPPPDDDPLSSLLALLASDIAQPTRRRRPR